MATILDQLKVVLGLETKGFPSAQRQLRGLTNGVQREIAGLTTAIGGVFTVAFGAQLVRTGTQMAGQFKDWAETSGETFENVQKIQEAAKGIGKDFGAVAGLFDKFLAFAEEARIGSTSEKLKLLERYGLTMADLRELEKGSVTARQLIEKMFASGIDPGDAAARTDLAKIFGTKGVGTIIGLMNELRELGPVTIIAEDEGKKLAEAEKSLERIKKKMALEAGGLAAKFLIWNETGLQRQKASREARAMFEDDSLPEQTRKQAKLIHEQLNSVFGHFKMELDEVLFLSKQLHSLRPAAPEQNPVVNTPSTPSRASLLIPPAGGNHEPEGLRERKNRAEEIVHTSVTDIFFRASNRRQQEGMLRSEIQRLNDEATKLEEEGKKTGKENPEAVAGIRKEVLNKSLALAELLKGERREIGPDNLAALGGFVGGAANVPSDAIERQETRRILEDILNGIQELPASMRTAIQEAMREHPINNM
jgi:hypothetical protein